MKAFLVSTLLLVSTWSAYGYSQCPADIDHNFLIKETSFQIKEYFGTINATFTFPNLLDLPCNYIARDGELDRTVTWNLPADSSIKVIYRDAKTGNVLQEDSIKGITIRYVNKDMANYYLRQGDVQSFSSVNFVLLECRGAQYELERDYSHFTLRGPMQIKTW